MIMPDQPTELTSTEFEQTFFAEAEKVTVEIEVLKETYDDLLAAIEHNGWEREEGLRTLLTLGLGYAQAERMEQGNAQERAGLRERQMNLESIAAVMKFRAYEFMKDNQILEMRMNALRTTAEGLKGVVWRLKDENAALRRELEQVKADNASLKKALAKARGESRETSRSWLGQLIQRLSNGS
jgi:uncharacterized protein YaaN involved in tellurite resistance